MLFLEACSAKPDMADDIVFVVRDSPVDSAVPDPEILFDPLFLVILSKRAKFFSVNRTRFGWELSLPISRFCNRVG